MSEFKIEITSVSDRENLVAEVWYKDDLLCELNTENESLEVEFYLNKNNSYKFDYYAFMKAITNAKLELLK